MTNDIPEEPQLDPLEIYGIIERDFLKKVRRFGMNFSLTFGTTRFKAVTAHLVDLSTVSIIEADARLKTNI
jgi:hypothetical protein